MRYLVLVVMSLFVVSCGDGNSGKIPDGFERLGGDGASHFVYVHEQHLDDKKAQRAAGEIICNKYGNEEYCEVYMWKDREKVAKELPIHGDSDRVGLYTIKNGRVKLKVLR